MKVRAMRVPSRQTGFTLIELVVVGVIAAILLTVAVGGLGGMFARKRMEGMAADFVADLQQARTEAVSRNLPVRVTFGTGCHVLHTNDVVITCNGATVTPAGSLATIRLVQRTVNDATFTVQPTGTPPAWIQFDNLTGFPTTDNNSVDPGALIGSAGGSWLLRVRVGPTGRIELCTTTDLAGYAAC